MSPVWNKLYYFKKDSFVDKWGEPDKLSDELLLRLDDFRRYVATPVYVTCGTQGKHAKYSQHYIGRAVDVVVSQKDKIHHPLDLILAAERLGFTGIGYYPHWSFRGIQTGGLHLDVRNPKIEIDTTPDYIASRWLGIKEWDKEKGQFIQNYYALNRDNLMRYKII